MRLISNLKRASYVGSAMALVLAAMPVVPIAEAFAEGADAEVTSCSELSTALSDDNVSTIVLANNLTGCSAMNLTAGKTIDGNNHSITFTTDGIDILVDDSVVLKDLNITAGKDAIIVGGGPSYDYALASQLSLNNVVLNAGRRGISYMSDNYNGANLTINNSVIQMTGISDYDTAYNSADTRGISLWDFGNSTATITNTTIQGFAYVINMACDLGCSYSNTTINLAGSTLKGRAGFNIRSDDATINISNSSLLGLNNQGGTTEEFANIVLESWTSGNVVNIENTSFANSINGAGVTNPHAQQFMIDDRGANTVTLSNCEFEDNSPDDRVSQYGPILSSDNSTVITTSGSSNLPVREENLPKDAQTGEPTKANYLVNGLYVLDDVPVIGEVPGNILVAVDEEYTVDGLENAGDRAQYEAHRYNGSGQTVKMTEDPDFVDGKITAHSAGYGAATVKFDIYKYDGTEIVKDTTYDRKIKIHAYEANVADTVYLSVDESKNDLSLDFKVNDLSTGEVYVEDDTVATITKNTDGTYKVEAQGVGTTKIYGRVTVNADNSVTKDEIELGTVEVYSLAAASSITIPKGATLQLDETPIVTTIGNPSALTAKIVEDGSTVASVTGTNVEDGTLSANAAGTATLGFYAGDALVGQTTVNVYTKPELQDVVLSSNNVGASIFMNLNLGSGLPNYSLSSSNQSLVWAFNTMMGAGWNAAGDATMTVTYSDSLQTTDTFNVKVSRFESNIQNRYDVVKGDNVTFRVSEAYDQASVSCTMDGVACGSNVTRDDSGNYTVATDDLTSGEYTLEFVDTVGGVEIATRSTTIYLHEIEVSESEVYVKKDGDPKTVTVSEKNGYGEICQHFSYPQYNGSGDPWDWSNYEWVNAYYGCQIVITDANGQESDGITVTAKDNDQYEITVNEAGQYTVTFSDGTASNTVTVYAIDFEVNDLEYHLSYNHKDDVTKLINAINRYWGENGGSTANGAVVHSNNGNESTKFIVSKVTVGGTVAEGDEYNFDLKSGVKANLYTMEMKALIGTSVVDTKTVKIYVYEMKTPQKDEFYGEMAADDTEYTFNNAKVSERLNSLLGEEMGTITAEVTSDNAGDVSEIDAAAGTVTVTKPGKYVVRYTDTMKNGAVADTWDATFKVYGLDAEADDEVFLNLNDNEKYTYTINPTKTYGLVRTTVKFEDTDGNVTQISRTEHRYHSGSIADVETFTIDPAEYGEGRYTVKIENLSAKDHHFHEVEEGSFYAVARESATIAVESGDLVEIESNSDWSVDYAYEYNTGELEVSGNKITLDTTDLPLGMTYVALEHDFNGQNVALKSALVIIYKVVADAETDPEGVTKDTVVDLINVMVSGNIGDRTEKLEAVLGKDWMAPMMKLLMAVMVGQEIDTRVSIIILTEDEVETEMLEAVEALGTDSVEYYDVSVLMEVNGVEIGKLHKLTDKLTVRLADAEAPESGYTRQYFVLRMHNGKVKILTEGEDYYIKNGIIYVESDEFSTYAVAYKDTAEESEWKEDSSVSSPNTGAVTEYGDSATVSMLTSIIAGITVVALAGAVKLAIRRK